jgi:hypothetical protein
MEPDDIIASYVDEVVRRIPRRQRRDVGLELRSLLAEELAGRAADAGRPADDALALQLLTEFGRPDDVADRYRPAGFTVIRPADAPRFLWVALGGVAVQWALTLPAVFGAGAGASGAEGAAGLDFWSRLAVWWLSWGLGAFWWPGFLITLTLIAGAAGTARRRVRARRGATLAAAAATGGDAVTGGARSAGLPAHAAPTWAPSKVAPAWAPIEAEEAWAPARVIDRDRVNRPVLVLFIALGMLGATLVIALPSLAAWAPGLPEPVLAAFAFDPGFLQWRAPWALLLWALALATAVAALVAGRWTRVLRRVSLAGGIAWLALLVWWIAAGPIFTTEPANGVTQLCLLVVAVIVLIDVVAGIRRLLRESNAVEKSIGVPKLGA